MKRPKNATADLHYYSARLKRKLNLFADSSAVVVEAPSGYGKTTAVQDYLKAAVSQSADMYWVTAVDEAPVALYRRFCHEIGKIDGLAGERLLKIGFPNAFTIGEVCDAIRAIECGHDAWLVIDNFQYLCAALPPSFLAALIEHGGSRLHIVILTQMLGRDYHSAIVGRGFLHVVSSDLRLTADDIRRYFALAGAILPEDEALTVLGYTEGWIIAVYLQLCAYRETGAFAGTAILRLMEHLVWDKLTGEQRTFLLQLSPFDAFTTQQICGLLGFDALPDYASDCLSCSFIQYEAEHAWYEPHSILLELMAQKRAERGTAFERECLERAGDWCRSEGKNADALDFYARIGDYERILSLDLARLIFLEIGERTFFDIAIQTAQNCPAEIRKAHPLSMLCVAWALKSAGMDESFCALMDELDGQLEEGDLLRAEWLLLSAYQHFPHISDMLPIVQKAALLFGGTCSRVILPEAPWSFGDYCQLAEFHTRPGEADIEADELEEFIDVYARLTNGHGSGAGALFRSEVAFYRGDLINTEIFAYKAAFLAESKKQGIIHLEAARMLAEVALIKGDTEGWRSAIDSMERAASYPMQHTFIFRAVHDTVRGIILVELGELGRIANWLIEGDFSSRLLLAPMVNNALSVHLFVLLLQGEFARLIGTLEAIPPGDVNKTALSALLIYLLLAVGYCSTGDRVKAKIYIERAAQKALPDGMVYLFASLSWMLQGLSEELFETKYPELLDKYRSVKKQFGMGWKNLRDALFKDGLPSDLTAREHEIALLAAEGLRNSEIAQRLFVAESTVRAHLRAIFQKLDVDRRAKLAAKLR